MNNAKPGSIIKGSKWSEPVEIKFIEDIDNYVHIIGSTVRSREPIDQIIPRDEFSTFCTEETTSLLFQKNRGKYSLHLKPFAIGLHPFTIRS